MRGKTSVADNTMPAQATCLATGQVEAMPYGLAYFNKMISQRAPHVRTRRFSSCFALGN